MLPMKAPHRDFDAAAAQWDEDPGRVRMAEDICRAMERHVSLFDDMDVLDFGCGTGLVSLKWAPMVRSVTGADTSQGMIDVFRAKARSQGSSNVHTRHLRPGDRIEGSYDVVISSMAFHHVEDVDALLSDMFRILKAPGYLCVADLDPDEGEFHPDNTGVFHSGFDRSDMMGRFRKAGFRRIRLDTAAAVKKPAADGTLRTFSIFLVSGKKEVIP